MLSYGRLSHIVASLVLSAVVFVGCKGQEYAQGQEDTYARADDARLVITSQRYIVADSTVKRVLAGYGATDSTKTVISSTFFDVDVRHFRAPLCVHTSDLDRLTCAGWRPTTPTVRRVREELDDRLSVVDEHIRSKAEAHRSRHEAYIRTLRDVDSLNVENWDQQVEPDSAIVTRFGPIIKPDADFDDLLPLPTYVTGEINYAYTHMGGTRWVGFMIGFDEQNEPKSLYLTSVPVRILKDI